MLFVLKEIEEKFQPLAVYFTSFFNVSEHLVDCIPEKGDFFGAQKEWYSWLFPPSHFPLGAKNVQLIAQGNEDLRSPWTACICFILIVSHQTLLGF